MSAAGAGLKVGEQAPDALLSAPVFAPDGKESTLRALVERRHALVVFLREYGCIACAEQMHDLLPRLPEIAALGVTVILIGNGTPEHATAFLERHALDDGRVTLVTDTALRTYQAAGLLRSAWATHGPRAAIDWVRAAARGHWPGKVDGDLRQQGGVLLLDEDGVVAWSHRNESLGDHPDPSDVVGAVLALRVERSPLPV